VAKPPKRSFAEGYAAFIRNAFMPFYGIKLRSNLLIPSCRMLCGLSSSAELLVEKNYKLVCQVVNSLTQFLAFYYLTVH